MAPLRSAPVPLLRDPFPGLRGALALLVPLPFGARSEVRGAALAFLLDAPFGAGASDERPVLFLRPVLFFSPLEPAAVPLRRLRAAQLLAARLSRPGATNRPSGAAAGGARLRWPSRMPR